jgi:NAD(P)-dependent dehydrogenase (short-subunit alcohol dehydrogenase family)
MSLNELPGTDLDDILFNRLGLARDECLGKTVVVTGAGRGIGLQTARSFAMLGARVILAEMSPETGQAAEMLIRSEGGKADFVQTDVSDSLSVRNLANQIHDRWEPVEILVNNAIRCPIVSIIDMQESLWDSVIATNLRGTFLTCKAFLPAMVREKRGVIINMVSTDALPGLSAYLASKQAILSFTQSLAQEIGPDSLKAIPFAPGMVETPGLLNVIADLAPRMGVSVEQIRKFSPHAAYDDLMPAEHAGAATAYLAQRLAERYHGKLVNGYEVLEQAGFLQPASSGDALSEDPHSLVPNASADRMSDSLVERLLEMLDDTAKEFDQLPIFVRPLASGGFKKKTHHSVEEWRRIFKAVQAGKLQPGILHDLDGLTGYYREAPAQMTRFTKDPELLEQARQLSQHRMELIRTLIPYLTD